MEHLEKVYRELSELVTKTQEYIEDAKAHNTKKAYSSDWEDFSSWCKWRNLTPLPSSPETVIYYLADLVETRKYKVSTIQRRISSISQAHQAKGLETPTKDYKVRVFMAGIKRKFGVAQKGKDPALVNDIKSMIDVLSNSLPGKRDKAVLLVGWAGARRRSELVSLDVEDLKFSSEGLTLCLRHSKTNQEGQEEKVSIWYGANPDTCPVRALQTWLNEAEITSGAVFRAINRHGQIGNRLSDKAVALIVKRTAEKAGLDPINFSGHSLRAGLATQSARNGLSERAIMKQTGHKSEAMVRKYIREGSLFVDNVTSQLGL